MLTPSICSGVLGQYESEYEYDNELFGYEEHGAQLPSYEEQLPSYQPVEEDEGGLLITTHTGQVCFT